MPRADFVITQGDTQPVFSQQILDPSDPAGVNLTGATVQLVLRNLTSSAPLTLTGVQTITQPATGVVEWQPSAADTAQPGSYMGKWVITWASGDIQSYPTDGYLWVTIEEDLAINTAAQIVTLPDVKDHLNLPASSRISDTKLLRWIGSTTALIEHEIGPVMIRTFDEWHAGGTPYIRLRRRPSTALGTSPIIELIACSEYTGPIEWPLSIVPTPDLGTIYSCMLVPNRATIVRRTAGGGVQSFPPMLDSVHVIYQAGQAVVPANVQEAALETVRVWYQTTMAVGSGARTRADQLDSGPQIGYAMPPSAMRLLRPNRRHPSIA